MPQYEVKIKFKHHDDPAVAWSAATRDCKVFRRWEVGYLDDFEAAYELAWSNDLNHVTEEDMVETAHALGYFREGEYDG